MDENITHILLHIEYGWEYHSYVIMYRIWMRKWTSRMNESCHTYMKEPNLLQKRGLHKWKKTYTYWKSPTSLQKEAYTDEKSPISLQKEAYIDEKSPTHIPWHTHDWFMSHEAYIDEKSPTHMYVCWAYIDEKSPTHIPGIGSWHTRDWFMSHVWKCNSVIHVTGAWHVYVRSHIVSYNTYEWVMLHVWMSRVTHMKV